MSKSNEELFDELEGFVAGDLNETDEVEDESNEVDDPSADLDDDSGDTGADEELSELEVLRAKLNERDAVIADLAKAQKKADSAADDDANTPDNVTGFQLAEVEWKDTEFFEDDFDFENLTPKMLNKLLNAAAKSGADFGAKNAAQQVVRSIPKIVKHNVEVQSSIQDAVKTFYASNEDLAQFTGAVSAVTQELASKNPSWPLDKLFNAAGKETRKRLGLAKPKVNKKPSAKGGSIKPKGQRGKRGGLKLEGLDSEIAAMMNM